MRRQESSYTVIMAAPRHHAMPTTLDFNSVRKFALKKDKVLGLEEDRAGRGRQMVGGLSRETLTAFYIGQFRPQSHQPCQPHT